MLERGPVQLNIPRDMFYGDLVTTIPKPMKVGRSACKCIYLGYLPNIYRDLVKAKTYES